MVEEFGMRSIVWKRVFLQVLGNDAETFTRFSLRESMFSLEVKMPLVTIVSRLTEHYVDRGDFAFLSLFLLRKNNGRIGNNVPFEFVLLVISGQRQS